MIFVRNDERVEVKDTNLYSLYERNGYTVEEAAPEVVEGKNNKKK